MAHLFMADRITGQRARMIALVAVASCAFPAMAAEQRTSFDHLTTGFELQGAHRAVPCESCHVNAVFKGTPRTCASCHSVGIRSAAIPKPSSHVMTSDRCEACHTQDAFSPALQFDHTEVRGSCASCHNNVQAPGKPADHIQTSGDCSLCHTTTGWGGTRFDHSQITGACLSCHNGTTATGKPANHIPSDNNCDSCHTTNAWTPARFDHAGVTAGTCSTCHNGIRATGKPVSHIPATAECDACHGTLAWEPARIDHTGITSNCQSCHNGTTATGKTAGHMTTARDCVLCHSYPVWTPIAFTHASPEYPGDHRGALPCTACHTTNTDQATWRFAAYRPNCAGCHANDFEPGPHNKTVADVKYTVAELQNCSGACHVYTDATLTTVARQRPGPEHRVTDGNFD